MLRRRRGFRDGPNANPWRSRPCSNTRTWEKQRFGCAASLHGLEARRTNALGHSFELSLALFGSPLLSDPKRKAEKFDRSVHVRRLPQINTDPATVGKDVVGFGTTTCKQLIADRLRKGNVHQAVAVHVADLS